MEIYENIIDSSYALEISEPILLNIESAKWQLALWNDRGQANGNKLRTYRRFKTSLQSEAYLDYNIPRYERSAFIKLRCGVLPLEIETGRYNGILYENRTCKLCNLNAIESECHFLIDCPLYDDIRTTIFNSAVDIDANFLEFDKISKMCFILSNTQIAPQAIRCVHKMFSRRKLYITR